MLVPETVAVAVYSLRILPLLLSFCCIGSFTQMMVSRCIRKIMSSVRLLALTAYRVFTIFHLTLWSYGRRVFTSWGCWPLLVWPSSAGAGRPAGYRGVFSQEAGTCFVGAWRVASSRSLNPLSGTSLDRSYDVPLVQPTLWLRSAVTNNGVWSASRDIIPGGAVRPIWWSTFSPPTSDFKMRCSKRLSLSNSVAADDRHCGSVTSGSSRSFRARIWRTRLSLRGPMPLSNVWPASGRRGTGSHLWRAVLPWNGQGPCW